MFNSSAIKFGVGFIAITLGAVGVWYAVIYFDPDARAEREAVRYLSDLEEQYKNDTYGGKTPEETLELFIAALEKGDIELASKYTLPEDRISLQRDLEEAKNREGFIATISRLKKLELLEKNEKTVFFVLRDGDGNISSQVVLDKNLNNVWKVIDF